MATPSILFITSTQAVGFSPSGKGGRLTVLPSDASGDLGLSIEALLAAMPARQKQVYVLTTEVWSQAVTVESRSLRRIDKAQIPQMLAFEAESFSGMSANAARTSIELLDAGPLETTYWVSQIDSTRFAQAGDAVAFNGGKLLGLLHPSGLPLPIQASKGDWTRLELWDDTAIAVSRQRRSPIRREFIAEPETAINSPAAARDFLGRNEIETGTSVELLKQSGSGLPADSDGSVVNDRADDELLGRSLQTDDSQSKPIGDDHAQHDRAIDLTREADLQSFLATWSKALAKPKQLPIILPVRAKASAQTKRTLGLALTAAVVIGVAAHYRWTIASNESRVESLTTQIRDLQAPIDQFTAQKKQLGELETELTAAQDKIQQLETQVVRYRGQLGIHRSRMATLLRALGENRPRDLMLSGVQGDGEQIRVVGRSVRPEAIIDFASTMAKRLEVLNLSIEVPRREALLMTAEGGPYEFEYIIRDGARDDG